MMESKDLWVELKPNRPSYMVLKGTYGEKIHKIFRMTRQGVRWRFQRLFSHVYVEAFESILMIEKTFGTQLREYAVRISRERYEMRKEILNRGFESAGDFSRKTIECGKSPGSDLCLNAKSPEDIIKS
jgi:hypothetical protein